MTRRFDGGVELIQTDGGSEFKEAFAQKVLALLPTTPDSSALQEE